MSSQDTMSYAASEEESAKALQSEIDKAKARIDALQKDLNAKVNALQADINRESQIVSSLQPKQKLHAQQADRLYQQVQQEQEQEQAQAQRERQQEEDKQSLMEKAADEAFPHGLF